jgi:hypothetical protein
VIGLVNLFIGETASFNLACVGYVKYLLSRLGTLAECVKCRGLGRKRNNSKTILPFPSEPRKNFSRASERAKYGVAPWLNA